MPKEKKNVEALKDEDLKNASGGNYSNNWGATKGGHYNPSFPQASASVTGPKYTSNEKFKNQGESVGLAGIHKRTDL